MERPRNLYELCEQTCESMELAPLNYYQGYWAAPVRAVQGHTGVEHQEACGTAYCRAGWMIANLEGKALPTEGDGVDTVHYGTRAKKMLYQAGIPDIDIEHLFAGEALMREKDIPRAKWGTPEYVAAGVEGLRNFMAKHEAKLRAAKITEDGSVRVEPRSDAA